MNLNNFIVFTVLLALVCGTSMSIKNREEGKKWRVFDYCISIVSVIAFLYTLVKTVVTWPITIEVTQDQIIIYYLILLFILVQIITNIVDTVRCKNNTYRIIYAIITLFFAATMAVFVFGRV